MGEKGPGLPPEVLLGLFQQCVKVKRIKFALYRSRVKVFPVGVYKGRERQTSRSLWVHLPTTGSSNGQLPLISIMDGAKISWILSEKTAEPPFLLSPYPLSPSRVRGRQVCLINPSLKRLGTLFREEVEYTKGSRPPSTHQDQNSFSCRTACGPQSRDQRAVHPPASACGHSRWLQMPPRHSDKWRSHSCHWRGGWDIGWDGYLSTWNGEETAPQGTGTGEVLLIPQMATTLTVELKLFYAAQHTRAIRKDKALRQIMGQEGHPDLRAQPHPWTRKWMVHSSISPKTENLCFSSDRVIRPGIFPMKTTLLSSYVGSRKIDTPWAKAIATDGSVSSCHGSGTSPLLLGPVPLLTIARSFCRTLCLW